MKLYPKQYPKYCSNAGVVIIGFLTISIKIGCQVNSLGVVHAARSAQFDSKIEPSEPKKLTQADSLGIFSIPNHKGNFEKFEVRWSSNFLANTTTKRTTLTLSNFEVIYNKIFFLKLVFKPIMEYQHNRTRFICLQLIILEI